MSDTVIVTGTIDLDPARHDEAVAPMIELMEATRAEAGNEAYTFSADVADPGRFHVVEQWASVDAMNAHMAAPHLARSWARWAASASPAPASPSGKAPSARR